VLRTVVVTAITEVTNIDWKALERALILKLLGLMLRVQRTWKNFTLPQAQMFLLNKKMEKIKIIAIPDRVKELPVFFASLSLLPASSFIEVHAHDEDGNLFKKVFSTDDIINFWERNAFCPVKLVHARHNEIDVTDSLKPWFHKTLFLSLPVEVLQRELGEGEVYMFFSDLKEEIVRL
jgi:hypothetical protein